MLAKYYSLQFLVQEKRYLKLIFKHVHLTSCVRNMHSLNQWTDKISCDKKTPCSSHHLSNNYLAIGSMNIEIKATL